MSMSNSPVDEPISYVRRKRRTKRLEVVANVIASSAQQDFSSKEICQKSSKTSRTEPNKLLESNKTTMNSLESGKDLEEAAQEFSLNLCWLNKSPRTTCNAKRKGKELYQEEKNNTMGFIDFFAQRENKGITISEKRVNSRSEEMTRTSNDHSRGQKLQFQDMANLYQVTLNYFLGNSMKEMSVWPRYHKPRAIVHPSKIISPSRFSQYYDQYMQRTSVPAPINFSLMKLLMGDETLTDEELIYANELLSTEDLSSGGQRVQQWPCSQVGNYQDMQRTSGSATSNFSFMKLLMEDEDSSILTEELNEKQFLSTQLSLSSEGQRVQQWPCSQVGNYQFENSVQQINLQSCQHQVLQQPQQISYMDLLTRDDIPYMDLLTRQDIPWI